MRSTTALAIQSWALYSVGLCLVLSRIAFRLLTLGSFARLQVDDWLMVFTLIPFTGMMICANKEGNVTDLSTLEPVDAVAKLKIRFVLEELQMVTTWLVKSCLLILYLRIFPSAASRRERICLAWLSVYNFVSFLVVQVLLFVWCHPVSNYWSLTPLNEQCSTYYNHAAVALAFSVTTTIAILLIPIPFIQTPRKFLLGILLVFGIVVLISAIMGRRYTLTKPTATGYLYWYIAEASVSIIFANLPFLTSLVVSTAPARIRKFSDNVSLTQWPRTYKDTPPLRAERLGSTATSISSLEPTGANDEKRWNVTPPLSPPAQLRRPSDPFPELERFSWSRRPSTRDTDVETMQKEASKLLT